MLAVCKPTANTPVLQPTSSDQIVRTTEQHNTHRGWAPAAPGVLLPLLQRPPEAVPCCCQIGADVSSYAQQGAAGAARGTNSAQRRTCSITEEGTMSDTRCMTAVRSTNSAQLRACEATAKATECMCQRSGLT
jgi:hypothetical protein